jgi:hypothetical protein
LPVASKPVLQPGDVVLFARLTLRQALRAYGLRGLIGWLGDLIVAFASWYTEGPFDGYWELVHVGIIVRWQERLVLLEMLPSTGFTLSLLPAHLDAHPGGVLVMPLSARYAGRFSNLHIGCWIAGHQRDRYRWGGLPFAILRSLVGWRSAGAMFCSEAVVALLVHLGIIPRALKVMRGDRIVEAEVEPQGYAPCEVARLPQLARAQGYVWKQWPVASYRRWLPVASYQLSVGRREDKESR